MFVVPLISKIMTDLERDIFIKYEFEFHPSVINGSVL
jgi:hypothetical protein